MLLIYSPKITNRIRYTCNLLFKDILGIAFEIVTDIDRFKNYSFEKINYSNAYIGDEIFLQAKNVLFETGITNQDIQITDWNGHKIFFQTGRNFSLPFDVFACTFYLVSRYEEYLPHIRDKFDRFNASESLSYKHDFLQKPVIDKWAYLLRDILLVRYPNMKFPKRKYKYLSTIDIDNAYAYKEKGPVRMVGAYAKSFAKFDMGEVIERTKVLLGLQKDPYDTYELQFDVQKRYGIKPLYFILLGDYAEHDRNVPFESPKFRTLIKHLSDYADVGIHPSFASGDDKAQLRTELTRLSSILNREITKSRQHFLKLRLPDTYRNLIEIDIKNDYSMGYASQLGFRAGTCTPFNFYDLDQEVETPLKVHPFAVMEATLKYYLKVDPEDAMEHVKPIIDSVKAVDGIFVSLWHNETLSNDKLWSGWQSLYEDVVKYACN